MSRLPVLVTGANKGIGLAVCRRILIHHPDYYVYLGSRDAARGEEAVKALIVDSEVPEEAKNRVKAIQIDVASDDSVRDAAAAIKQDTGTLHALINNAGMMPVTKEVSLEDARQTLDVNLTGVHRVITHFLPLLSSDGRIVNVSSGSAPSFVEATTPPATEFFLKPQSYSAIEDQMKLFLQFYEKPVPASFAGGLTDERLEDAKKHGFGKVDVYGFSKALLNCYTLHLANEHPNLTVNACTPGFIHTDLTDGITTLMGKSAEDMGMKAPDHGSKVIVKLLTEKLEGRGRFYGSDSERSPFGRYRSPGSEPYDGSDGP